MLCNLEEEKKKPLAKIIYAYNCRKNESMGYTPYYLIFGHSPCLLIDLLFNIVRDNAHGSYKDYVSCWKERMQEAYWITARNTDKGPARGKANCDKKVLGRDLQPSDRVLIRNLTPRGGTGKIESYWEDQVFRVKERNGDDSPVYQISPENGIGRDRVIHRNLLLPCDHLPLELPSAQTLLQQRNVQRPARRKKTPRHNHQQQPASDSSSEDDDGGGTYQWHWQRAPAESSITES